MPKPKRKVSIAKILQSNVESQERLLTELVAATAKDREGLFPKVPRTLTFQVTLHSHWANEGEQSVYITEKKQLQQVLLAAVEKFMSVNKRSDVQAYWHVSVILPSGREVRIPDECWEHLRDAVLKKK